ncbi:uncharacterized protein ACBR49_014036 isoform 2-T2 [Aulostomus maculatus]
MRGEERRKREGKNGGREGKNRGRERGRTEEERGEERRKRGEEQRKRGEEQRKRGGKNRGREGKNRGRERGRTEEERGEERRKREGKNGGRERGGPEEERGRTEEERGRTEEERGEEQRKRGEEQRKRGGKNRGREGKNRGRTDRDELDNLLVDNRKVMLQSIADDLRARLPLHAMLPSETSAQHKMQQQARPTVHVDGFLYDDELVDALCEEGTMSRSYCLSCGSYKTAPLEFLSHSFSVSELQFLYQNVLPDLSGRTLVDVGSRLGAVLYGGYVYSSASQLVGLELSEEFVQLQNDVLQKYQLTDRVQVLHADVCTQDVLLQNADVLVMNNVFEYFMEPAEQVRAWRFIMLMFRKKGSLLVTVPGLQESLSAVQEVLLPGWVEELPVDSDVYLGRDADPDALRQIHLYRVIGEEQGPVSQNQK